MELNPRRLDQSQSNPDESTINGNSNTRAPKFELEQGMHTPETFAESLPHLVLVAIYTSPNKGEPMQRQDAVLAIAGVGLEGDRYAKRTGVFSGTNRIPDEYRQVSIISRPDIEEANQELLAEGEQAFTEAETRRNLVVDLPSDYLNSLVGETFFISGVEFEGVEDCTPCERPGVKAGKRGFVEAFENRGGIRARIINGGIISLK